METVCVFGRMGDIVLYRYQGWEVFKYLNSAIAINEIGGEPENNVLTRWSMMWDLEYGSLAGGDLELLEPIGERICR